MTRLSSRQRVPQGRSHEDGRGAVQKLRVPIGRGPLIRMRLALIRGAFFVVAMQAEHIQQRVAALGQSDAERVQIQLRRADSWKQLLLFGRDVLRHALAQHVDLVDERGALGRHRLDAHDRFLGLLMLPSRLLQQRRPRPQSELC